MVDPETARDPARTGGTAPGGESQLVDCHAGEPLPAGGVGMGQYSSLLPQERLESVPKTNDASSRPVSPAPLGSFGAVSSPGERRNVVVVEFHKSFFPRGDVGDRRNWGSTEANRRTGALSA